MKLYTHTLWLAATFAASFLVGCSHNNVTPPIGSWNADGATLTFKKDGTFTLTNIPTNSVQHVRGVSGTYTMVDTTHIKLDVTSANNAPPQIHSAPQDYSFSISSGVLSISLKIPGHGILTNQWQRTGL